jgi:hypothetical protein
MAWWALRHGYPSPFPFLETPFTCPCTVDVPATIYFSPAALDLSAKAGPAKTPTPNMPPQFSSQAASAASFGAHG